MDHKLLQIENMWEYIGIRGDLRPQEDCKFSDCVNAGNFAT